MGGAFDRGLICLNSIIPNIISGGLFSGRVYMEGVFRGAYTQRALLSEFYGMLGIQYLIHVNYLS